MFYYPAVLKRHTGCFSTIWLVATKGIKVSRRDFLKVNVKTTCDNIMNYLLEQVPPPRPGLPHPRFSLYLSSQLQYGVIVVFHRQCAILLEEIQFIVNRLLKQKSVWKIDLDDHRKTTVLPDVLSLMEETEGAPDPLFGEMHLQEAMLSPSALIQMSREFLREASPELPEQTSPAVSAAPDLEGITASPETITMRETEPVTIPAAEFEGEDFSDHHLDTIDLLLAQTDPFTEAGAQLPEGVTPQQEERELEREGGDQEREKMKDVTGSTTEPQPTTASSEDAAMMPQEESGPPAEIPGPPREQITPVSSPVLPSPPSAVRKRRQRSPELEEVTPKVRRRKRQLIFFDPETQISESEQQQQINNLFTETRHPVLPLPVNQRIIPASELFNNPCGYLPNEIRSLWRQAATITPLPGSDLQVGERGPESTDSEREREREMMEAAEREEQRLEQIPKEVQRDMAESEIGDLSGDVVLSLEVSDQREASREISPIYTSDREGSIIFRSVPKLQDIPEAEGEMGRAAAESPGLLPDLEEYEGKPVLFHSLLPPEVNRRRVSNIFQKLLENLSSRRMRAEQDEPYGDILIFPGANYDAAQLE